MDAPERERILAAIDVELNDPGLARIQRVRLLDLWWRVATDGGPPNLERVEVEFLSNLVGRMARTRLSSASGENPISQPAGTAQLD
jgi:hypothetical protein